MTNIYYLLGINYNKNEIEKIIYSKLWFTYRSYFPNIEGTYLTNDIGWGCTIRSGQMLIGNTIIRKNLGSNWKYDKTTISNEYHKIINKFQDNYDGEFSLHNILKYYKIFEHEPGDWIGPYSFCKILEKMEKNLMGSQIKYYNFINAELDINSIEEQEGNISYLLTFPVRLGIKEISSKYYDNILYLTKNKYFNGIIGGNNKASYYFIGSNDNNKLIYLDPHIVNRYNIEESIEDEYHTNEINELDISLLSPTFSISFYFESYKEIIDMRELLDNTTDKYYPIISVNSTESKECHSYTIKEDDEQWEFIEDI